MTVRSGSSQVEKSHMARSSADAFSSVFVSTHCPSLVDFRFEMSRIFS